MKEKHKKYIFFLKLRENILYKKKIFIYKEMKKVNI